MGEIKVLKEDHEIDKGRRKAMAKIAIGVGAIAGTYVLPEKWTRPIIGQMVLPANAATSGASLIQELNTKFVSGDETTDTVTIKVTGFVSPPVAGIPVEVTVTPVIS